MLLPSPVCLALPPGAGPTCWLLYGYALYSIPVLRLPLLAYHLYIISPAGRAAVGTSRMPWLARLLPLYWGQLRYFPGSRLVKTAELDPSRSAWQLALGRGVPRPAEPASCRQFMRCHPCCLVPCTLLAGTFRLAAAMHWTCQLMLRWFVQLGLSSVAG